MSFHKKKNKKTNPWNWEEDQFKRIEWDPLIRLEDKDVQKEKENYFKRWKEGIFLVILTKAVKKIVFNKLFIGVTIFMILAFLTSNLLGIYLLKPEKLDLKTICNTWIPFAILILYVMFFEIYTVHLLFFDAKQEGMINLEIRSGYNQFKIFCQRTCANKIIIFLVLTILILTQGIIGYTATNLYLRLAIQHTLLGFLLIYLLDLFLFGFLLLLSNLNSSIPASISGTILGLLFACGMIFNTVSVGIVENKFNHQQQIKLKEKNSKYSFMDRMQKIIDKYGGQKSILGQSIDSFYELRYLINDDRFDQNTGFYTQNQIAMETYLPWHYLKSAYYNYDDYLLELMANGLLLNINEIPIFFQLKPDANPTNLNVDNELMENNFIFQFLNSLIDNQKKDFGYQYETAKNSLFRSFGKNEKKSEAIFTGDAGLFSFIKTLKTSEQQEIGQLIQDAAIYLYQDKYSSYPSDDFDSAAVSLEPDLKVHIWKYDLNQNSDYHQFLLNHVWVNDGARTFIKIFFELLINFMDLSSPDYGTDNAGNTIQISQYNHQVSLLTYLNPFTAFSRTFFELSNNEAYLQTNYLDEWCQKTYQLIDDKKDLRKAIPFENGNQFLKINLTQNYFNDAEQKNVIMLSELNDLITKTLQQYLPEIQLDFFVDFNKKIPIEKTAEGFIVDLQVMEKNQKNYRNYLNIKLVFNLISPTNIAAQEKQKQQLMSSFNETYLKYSAFFNKFINGKNYSQIQENKSSFLAFLPIIVLPIIALFELCLGYWLFYKNLIK